MTNDMTVSNDTLRMRRLRARAKEQNPIADDVSSPETNL